MVDGSVRCCYSASMEPCCYHGDALTYLCSVLIYWQVCCCFLFFNCASDLIFLCYFYYYNHFWLLLMVFILNFFFFESSFLNFKQFFLPMKLNIREHFTGNGGMLDPNTLSGSVLFIYEWKSLTAEQNQTLWVSHLKRLFSFLKLWIKLSAFLFKSSDQPRPRQTWKQQQKQSSLHQNETFRN